MPIPLPLLLAGLYVLTGLTLATCRAAVRLEDPDRPHDLVLLAHFVLEMAIWPVALLISLARVG